MSSTSTHGRLSGRARHDRRTTTTKTKAQPLSELLRALAAHASYSQNGMLAVAVCFLITYPDDAQVVSDSLSDVEARLREELAEAKAGGWEDEASEATRLVEQVIAVRASMAANDVA